MDNTEIIIQIKKILFYRIAGKFLWQYGMVFLLILIGFAVKRLLEILLERKIKVFVEKTKNPWDDRLLEILIKPIGWICLLVVLYFSINILQPPSGIRIFLKSAFKGASLFILAYILYRAADILSDFLLGLALKSETKLDDQLVPIIRKSLKTTIVVLFSVLIIENFGYNVAGLLAGLGLGGLAFALAAKDTIANVFGSITIFVDKPFHVGDRVVLAGKDGVVEEIGLRSTRIRTLQGHLVTIPNSQMVSEVIENISRRPTIKQVMNLGLTYDTPPEKIKQAVRIIKDILSETPHLEPDYYVFFNQYADFYLNIIVYFWVTPPDYWKFLEINEQINLKILGEFNKEKIEFAFPTQTVYVKK